MAKQAPQRAVRRTARPPLEEDVGPRLRAHREQRGLSLRELARRLGVSPSAISQIETGKSRPSVSTLYSIVSELGMSLDELFGAPKPAQPAAAARRGSSRSTAATWSEAGGTARRAGRQPRDDRPRVGRPLGTADAGPGPRPGLPLRHLRRRRILERRQPVDPPLGPRVRADPQRHARGHGRLRPLRPRPGRLDLVRLHGAAPSDESRRRARARRVGRGRPPGRQPQTQVRRRAELPRARTGRARALPRAAAWAAAPSGRARPNPSRCSPRRAAGSSQ